MTPHERLERDLLRRRWWRWFWSWVLPWRWFRKPASGPPRAQDYPGWTSYARAMRDYHAFRRKVTMPDPLPAGILTVPQHYPLVTGEPGDDRRWCSQCGKLLWPVDGPYDVDQHCTCT